MRKFILIIVVALYTVSGFSQTSKELFLVTDKKLSGNARFVGMGGAFNSVGGNSSGVLNNPAGIGIYRKADFSISTSSVFNRSTTNYFGNEGVNSQNGAEIEAASYVGPITFDNPETGWFNVNIGFFYNVLNDFNNSFYVKGDNSKMSMIDDFTQWANVDIRKYNSLSSREELASETYLINMDTVTGSFVNPYNKNGYGHTEILLEETSGTLGEYTVAFGGSFIHKLYLGGSFGIRSLFYKNSRSYKEDDPNDIINELSNFTYNSTETLTGTGFNFSFGAIFRPIESLRFGVSIHSPTLYSITSSLNLDMQANYDDGYSSKEFYSKFADLEYNLTTPYRFTAGVSYYFNKRGLISVDYEMLDYTLGNFSNNELDIDNKIDMDNVNSEIDDLYQVAHKLNVGAEYKIGFMSLRGGYVYKTSPFTSANSNYIYSRSNYSYQAFTGGLGFNFGSYYLDLAYLHSITENERYLYGESINEVKPAEIVLNENKIFVTLGFRF